MVVGLRYREYKRQRGGCDRAGRVHIEKCLDKVLVMWMSMSRCTCLFGW